MPAAQQWSSPDPSSLTSPPPTATPSPHRSPSASTKNVAHSHHGASPSEILPAHDLVHMGGGHENKAVAKKKSSRLRGLSEASPKVRDDPQVLLLAQLLLLATWVAHMARFFPRAFWTALTSSWDLMRTEPPLPPLPPLGHLSGPGCCTADCCTADCCTADGKRSQRDLVVVPLLRTARAILTKPHHHARWLPR